METTISSTGTQLFWHCAAGQRSKVRAAIESVAPQFVYYVRERQRPSKALALAIIRTFPSPRQNGNGQRTKLMVRATGKGFSAVLETVGEEHNAYNPSQFWTIPSDADEAPDFGHDKLTLAYLIERDAIGGDDLGKALSHIALASGAIIIRRSGGVYWLAEGTGETFRALASAVEDAVPGTEIHLQRVIVEPGSIRAIGEALAYEVQQAQASVDEWLGEHDVAPPRFAKGVESLRAKIARYETDLGATFASTHAALGKVEEVLDVARFAEQAAESLLSSLPD